MSGEMASGIEPANHCVMMRPEPSFMIPASPSGSAVLDRTKSRKCSGQRSDCSDMCKGKAPEAREGSDHTRVVSVPAVTSSTVDCVMRDETVAAVEKPRLSP
jgi:hypothetical protein